jgi:hypothetical protein
MRVVGWACAWVLAGVFLSATGASGQGTGQAFPLADASGIVEHGVKAEAVEYLGRKAVRVTPTGENGLAMLRGVDFQDGVIEAEIALKVTTPPGVRMPGFVGIAFRANLDEAKPDASTPGAAKPDTSKYELFYLRPGNSHSEDQAMRNHSVQYTSEPDYSWYRLRRNWPEVYESHAELQFAHWTKVKIEVAGRSAKLYLNGDESPSLVVDGLKGENLHGGVGLWGYDGEEAYFSNVKITPAAPKPVKNGSDAAGAWGAKLMTDFGAFDGVMKLARDGGSVSGSWTGSFGESLPVTGTWRDGYVELSLAGTWTKEMPGGNPGPVTANLAGWIDGEGAGGRVRVLGRADGRWSAERKP